MMNPIDSAKGELFFADSATDGKPRNTSAAIATHGSFVAVGVEIAHIEIIIAAVAKQEQAVGTHSEMPVAHGFYCCNISFKLISSVVDQNEIVAGAFVFFKVYIHTLVIWIQKTLFFG